MTAASGAAGFPRVFTIPPGAPFLPTLARALLGGALVRGFSAANGPLALSAATVFVPTRRAARALASVLAEQVGAPSVVLPRILPLGDLDTMETELIFDAGGFDDPLRADLPTAIGDTARRVILTRLILQWAAVVRRAVITVDADGTRHHHPHEDLIVATSAADAWSLSSDLAALSDDLAAEGIGWDRVKPLGTERYDDYWRITLDFLGIVMTTWPAILAGRGEVDGVVRRAALIEAEIARLRRGGLDGPVIVAGSTGSTPAVAKLIACISRLPEGAVVLPGLDLSLDEAGWTAVGGAEGDMVATHPQTTLKRLLQGIGIGREAVMPLGEVPMARHAREVFVGQALRPAETTDLWRGATPLLDIDAALADLTVIEAADEREEALALAIALREAVEGTGSAVLVTPDRTLGRRVREELVRWSIEIDESGGEPLGTTPAGALARLVLDCALQDLAPVEVLALLAHPLARFGRPRAEVVDLARTLEIAILRGVMPPRALHDPAGLVERARLASRERHAPDPLRRLDEGAFRRLAAFLGDVVAALGPLHRLGADTPLPDWLAAHAAVIDAIAVDPEGNSVLTGVDGHALTTLFETFAEAPEAGITLDCAGYGALFDRFCAETPVRGPNRSHPRVKILGLLEARLLSADLVLLGGLDETVWPPQSETDAFLNRPMRASLGLSPPERRIGQTAHDLVMLMGQPRVILSRARKRGGTPTVPSRFLLRMQALAGERWAAVQARGTRYTDLAATLDKPERSITIPRPNPKPPVDLRPTGLSVTRIETLRRDPYSIYAERILNLRPAEPIGALMGPRDYGTTFHGVLRDAALAFGTEPRPADAAERLAALTETAFADAQADVPFRTFHWPRIQGWARAYLTWDADRRMDHLLIEQQGAIDIPLDDGSSFRLTANADRIEASGDGRVTVIDYKTGRSPSLAQVKVGFSPQLTLEAAMVEKGGFAELGSGARVEGAAYVKFGTGEAVEDRPLAWKDAAFPDVVAEHFGGLVTLLNQFRSPDTPYPPRPFPQYASDFGDYDHLSRVREWSTNGGDGE